MASYNSRRSDPAEDTRDIVIWLTIAIALIDLLAMLIGLTFQRLLTKYIETDRIRFLIWLVPSLLSGYLYFQWYQHGLSHIMATIYAAYLLVIIHHLKILEAPTLPTSQDLKTLWSVSWPLWISTLGTIPIGPLSINGYCC
jgi:hypothetical protein